MSRLYKFLASATVFFALFSPAQATPLEKAREITIKAATLLDEKGVEGARPFFYQEGEFRFGEIYVNVIDQDGVWLIYPPKPTAEGRSALEVRDVENRYLVREILEVANKKGEGWVEYRWINPVTRMIQPKITYVKAVPSRGVIAYVGIYP